MYCNLGKSEEAERLISEYFSLLFPEIFAFGGERSALPIGLSEQVEKIRGMLKADAEFAYQCDPAAGSVAEVIICYPGFFAIAVHRLASRLYREGMRLYARILSEYAHSKTGIDIHPGAEIGSPFFIDHGTGVVIGETCVIGSRVVMYQGVTLGAKRGSRGEGRNKKRHPTVGDDCVIYTGATILGGDTLIGNGCIIGCNTLVTGSLSPGTRVVSKE